MSDAARAAWRRGAGAREAGWALADQAIVSAANFVTVYLFARRLDAAAFGVLMLAHTGLLLVTSIQHALLVQPHNVLAAGLARADYQQFTAVLTALQAAAMLVTCGALAVAGSVVVRFDAPTGQVILALAVAAAPWLAQEYVRRVLYTRRATRAACLNDVVSYGLQVAGAAALVVGPGAPPSPIHALAVLGGSSLAAAALGAWQLRDHVRFGRETMRACTRVWREVWGFGKWLSAQNALAWAGSQGDVWIVTTLLGTEAVGMYRAATHLANLMNPLRQATYSHLPPRASLALEAGGRTGLSRWIVRVRWLMIAAIVPFVVVLGLFPDRALALAYGERFAGTGLALVLALVTLSQSITYIRFSYDAGLLALRASRALFLVHLIPVVLLVTVGVGAIHALGLLGVPVFGIVSGLALIVATRYAYLRQLRAGAPRLAMDATA